jgi:hypothetical protein
MKKILLLSAVLTLLGFTGCIVVPEHHHTVVVPAPAPVVVEPAHP